MKPTGPPLPSNAERRSDEYALDVREKEVYPPMLFSMYSAQKRVFLNTYITVTPVMQQIHQQWKAELDEGR